MGHWDEFQCLYDPTISVQTAYSLQWRHNGRYGVSKHQPPDCLLNRLFWRRSKKISTLRVTGLLCGKFTGHRWIPRTNGQLHGKCVHLITSSCYVQTAYHDTSHWCLIRRINDNMYIRVVRGGCSRYINKPTTRAIDNILFPPYCYHIIAILVWVVLFALFDWNNKFEEH